MIQDINKIALYIDAGLDGWTANSIENVWVKNKRYCSSCKKEINIGTKRCTHCNSFFIGSAFVKVRTSDFEYIIDKDKNKIATRFDPIKKSTSKSIFKLIEHSAYRFDLLKIDIEITGEYVFNKNPYFIEEKDRSSDINYTKELTSEMASEYKIKDFKLKFISCFSYDLNKKPGERLTLESEKVGNFVPIDKANVYALYPDDKCSDVDCSSNFFTTWVKDSIKNANQNKMLKNTLLKFEEPSLRTELAIKHNLLPHEMIIKNKDATKLHEILGVSKACLKFIIDPDYSKYSEIEVEYKDKYKSTILELYYELGDSYRKFFKDMQIFYNNKEEYFSGYSRARLTELYLAGYNMNRLFEYLTEECKWQQGLKFEKALNDLSDYVKMCEEMELKDYDRYPKALRTRHDVMVMRYNSIKMNHKEEESFNKIVEKYKILEHKTSKYVLKIAKNPKELVHEGSSLNHCVGSYASRMANEENIIFFLRDITKVDESLVTVELLKLGNPLDGFKLKLGQCKGSFNRNLTPQERSFMSSYAKNILSKAYINELDELTIRKNDKNNEKTINLEEVLKDNQETLEILNNNLLKAE